MRKYIRKLRATPKIMKREYRTLLEYIWKPGVNEWIPKKYLLLSYVGNVDGPNPIEETWKVIKDILLEKAPPKYKIFRNKFNIKATRHIYDYQPCLYLKVPWGALKYPDVLRQIIISRCEPYATTFFKACK